MGAKKIGLSDCEFGKELFLPLNKLDDPQDGDKVSREKIIMDLILDRELTVSLLDADHNELNTIKIENPEEKCLLKVVLAYPIVGNTYYLKAESTDGELKKSIFFEPQR